MFSTRSAWDSTGPGTAGPGSLDAAAPSGSRTTKSRKQGQFCANSGSSCGSIGTSLLGSYGR
eukprot:5480621-Alexandrium_andersonii.AAC.1